MITVLAVPMALLVAEPEPSATSPALAPADAPEPSATPLTVLTAALVPTATAPVAARVVLAPTPAVEGSLEAEGLEELLEQPPREGIGRVLKLAGRYLEVHQNILSLLALRSLRSG